MNFTRDPIIETVITPREGCKLVVRSSKGASQEDYYVDALEVVSFGHSFFFRSIERPKSFLVPVSDYEIFEEKEPKLALKNASAERSIKIGGGREPLAPRREPTSEEGARQREGKRRRGRRGRDRGGDFAPQEPVEQYSVREEEPESLPSLEEEVKEKAPSFISKLFPPPPTLIKETLSRYKSADPAAEDLFPSRESVSLEETSESSSEDEE